MPTPDRAGLKLSAPQKTGESAPICSIYLYPRISMPAFGSYRLVVYARECDGFVRFWRTTQFYGD
jgi:hypothetical protein